MISEGKQCSQGKRKINFLYQNFFFIAVTEYIAKHKNLSNPGNVKTRTKIHLGKVYKTLTKLASLVHLCHVGISPIKIKACKVFALGLYHGCKTDVHNFYNKGDLFVKNLHLNILCKLFYY